MSEPDLLDKQMILSVLGINRLSPREEYGQNFLISRSAALTMLQSAELTEGDSVLEVGPGLGAITQLLIKRVGKLVAIEIDPKMVELLNTTFANHKNLTVLNDDVLGLGFAEIRNLVGDNYKVVSSLPYQPAKKIIRKIIEARALPSVIVVLIQKEVAEKYVAAPPNATFLSMMARGVGDPEIVETVPAGSFFPVPKVDGAILRIKIHTPGEQLDVDRQYRESLMRFVKVGFSSPRKKLASNLAALTKDKGKIEEIMRQRGLLSTIRAGELTLSQWQELYEALDAGNLFSSEDTAKMSKTKDAERQDSKKGKEG